MEERPQFVDEERDILGEDLMEVALRPALLSASEHQLPSMNLDCEEAGIPSYR